MTDSENWYSEKQATLGDRIAAARESAGLSQSALAERIGVRQKTLRAWESDQAEPRANRLQMLAAMLGVSLRWLLTGEGEGIAPPASPDEAGDSAFVQTLADLQALRTELMKVSDRIGYLERKLRTQLGAASG
jgi:HTH-type transcriptional regulator, cell division transcriptional repressor